MPFNIHEIAIRMQVSGNNGQPQCNGSTEPREAPLDKEALIRECVRRTLEAIKVSKER
jgi:hypothetical protein